MAVLNAVRGWEYHAGLPHINDVGKEHEEEEDNIEELGSDEVEGGEVVEAVELHRVPLPWPGPGRPRGRRRTTRTQVGRQEAFENPAPRPVPNVPA